MRGTDFQEGEMVNYLNELGEDEFRQLFSKLMEEMDFSIKSSRGSGERLLLEAERKGEGEEGSNYVIGVKRGCVQPEEIQELVHQKKDFRGMFISTEKFSEDALSYGKALDIELVDGNNLVQLLREFSLLEDIRRRRNSEMLDKKGARFLPSVGELENLMKTGLSALRRGNLDVAIEYANRVVSLKPNYDLGWALKARVFEKMGHWDEALDAYKKALLCNIEDVELWLGLGLALFNLERHEEELEAYDQALKIDRNFTKAWLNKGATLHKLERYGEAIECYDEILKRDPKNVEVLNNKALALKALNDPGKALTFYTRATEADPGFLDAHLNKALLLQELGRNTDATKELDEALRIRPSDPKIWFFKGSIHFDLKQKKQAIEAFEKVIELDPKFKNARRMLSKSKRIKVKKKVSRDEYPCFGEYEKGEEGCEECDIREQCMEKRMK